VTAFQAYFDNVSCCENNTTEAGKGAVKDRKFPVNLRMNGISIIFLWARVCRPYSCKITCLIFIRVMKRTSPMNLFAPPPCAAAKHIKKKKNKPLRRGCMRHH
jgi:hypothetical protein